MTGTNMQMTHCDNSLETIIKKPTLRKEFSAYCHEYEFSPFSNHFSFNLQINSEEKRVKKNMKTFFVLAEQTKFLC